MHEIIQAYIEQLYCPYADEIKRSLFFYENERYGELYYYSLVKLLNHLQVTSRDHFLDIGSGLGKLIFQLFLSTDVASVTGIEINEQRHIIAHAIHTTLQQQLPDLFAKDRQLQVIQGDFLNHSFDHISMVYVCSTIFSFELLYAMGKKINAMQQVKKVASFRRLPCLIDFKLRTVLDLHCSWDKVACYIYERK